MPEITCFLFVLLAAFYNANAQTLILNPTNTTGPVRFYDPRGLLSNKMSLNYRDINGDCFWNNDWNPALLTLKDGSGYKLQKVKMNFYTNDIHYVDKTGTELVAAPGEVKKVVFYDRTDTLKVIGVFRELISFAPKASYAQILYDGKIQLLKINTTALKKDDFNPMVGRDTFHFSSAIKYFLSENGSQTQLKGLNKNSILSVIKATDEIEAWLKVNNNKLKNETEIISFLDFYSLTQK